MKIAILGAGHAGCVVAGDLSMKGHEVTLIKTSNAMHNENFQYLLDNNGEIKLIDNGTEIKVNIHKVTNDISEIKNNEVIIIYIQTTYHEQLIKRIVNYLQKDQIIIINPGYLSTAYFLKYKKEELPIIVEAESSFIDSRIVEPGVIKVMFRNVRNPVGVYPSDKTNSVKEKLKSLDYHLEYISTVEAALHNPNLIVHTVGAIMTIPRIEKTNGDYYMYREAFTPSVWRILEQLDSEKMSVMEKLGFERLPYVEACKYRNSLNETRDAKEVFFWYADMPTQEKGPLKVDSRYISEDVPQGLVMLETLGKELNVSTPICTSLIEIASAALSRDLRKEGRTTERLGRKNVEMILNDSIKRNENKAKEK